MTDADISRLACSCQDDLSSLSKATRKAPLEGWQVTETRDFVDLYHRFTQWAGNLGAFQPANSPLSLTHRLRDGPVVRASITDILRDLNDSNKSALDIISGRRANRTREPLIISETDLDDFEISSRDSDSIASSTSVLIDVPDEFRDSEIQMLVSAIKVSIDSLFRASVFIRKFAPNDRRQRASRSKAFDSRADVMYVGERYPILRSKNESLIPKLGEANARRRQYFKYRRDHREKLASNADDDANKNFEQAEPQRSKIAPTTGDTVKSGTMKASHFEKSEATEFLADTAATKQKKDTLNIEDDLSAVSLAATIIESSEGELQFPPLPFEGETNDSFECPYCLEIILLKSSNKQSQWRKHIVRDLQPYICTFPGCGLETFASDQAWFDHEILVHRLDWVCPLCQRMFAISSELKYHIRHDHEEQIPESQLQAVVLQSKRPKSVIHPKECPFCDVEWALLAGSPAKKPEQVVVPMDQFRKHVGHHLLQVSLFSLPRQFRGHDLSVDSASAAPGTNTNSPLLIAVMGCTATGKSNFIKRLMDPDAQEVPGIGNTLLPCTRETESYTSTIRGRQFIFLDTPGFDDTSRGETEVIANVVKALIATDKEGFKLSGILYLHRITDPRIGWSALRSLTMLCKLCGNDSFRNVVMVTTHWDVEDEQRGESREAELIERTELWGSLIAKGARTRRFYNTRKSAIDIVWDVVALPLTTLQVQEEMVEQGLDMGSTAIGQALKEQLSQTRIAHEKQIELLRREKNEAMQVKDEMLAGMLEEEEATAMDRLKEVEKQEAQLREGEPNVQHGTSKKRQELLSSEALQVTDETFVEVPKKAEATRVNEEIGTSEPEAWVEKKLREIEITVQGEINQKRKELLEREAQLLANPETFVEVPKKAEPTRVNRSEETGTSEPEAWEEKKLREIEIRVQDEINQKRQELLAREALLRANHETLAGTPENKEAKTADLGVEVEKNE